MEFAVLAQCFEALEGTSSRRNLVQLVTTLFRQVEHPEEIQQICYLMQGRVAPLFMPLEMGMAEKAVLQALAQASSHSLEQITERYATLGDLGLVAAQIQGETEQPIQKVSVNEVFTVLQTIAQTAGKGAIEKKRVLLVGLLDHVDGESAKYSVRIVLGKLRLGIGDATILDALAITKWNDAKKRKLLEGVYHVTSDLGLIARTLWEHPEAEEAQRAIASLDIAVGRPIHSQLAERLPTAEAIIEKMGSVVAQYKYDGFRVQIHKNGQQIAIFSRNLENLTDMFPEILEATRTQVQAEQAILDGEALAYNATSEEFLPFQETTRRRRKHGVALMAQELPLKAFVFDILYKDGASLLEYPLEERLKVLEETIPQTRNTLMVTRSHLVDDAKSLTLLFDEAISKGLEGLVVKRWGSHYEAGARNYNWVKIKRHAAGALDDTIDGVLLGYLFGRGKRAALGAGALLVGVYDARQDRFVTVTKIGTGLSDEQWGSIRERTKGLPTDRQPARVFSLITPSVWLKPAIVIEVLADEITRSPNHTAGKVGDEPGYALRFPRLIAFRDRDKQPEDATTVEEVIEMYQRQGKR
ncbi:ATP-dependent DNA ligase [Ktedonobacter racemifer]|uniref:Probable DNA ligase n=1 Tax=Ktedonobacter racemifer DSM 44963 TaxID=485913 RepID=D6TUZ0_KTERA|nr:ATP-dependent DNA ligase [Ktedonobacter racemifer]EFH85316.1 DNA ligase I, ATP-dependent Dnl1 [Ktedonobacter racemifer DSM 44963]